MEDLRPNDERAKYAIVLIWIVLFVELVSIVSSYFQYDLLQKVNQGVTFSDESLEQNDLREQVIGIVLILIRIVSAITFIRWFRRAYFNLHLRVTNLAHPENSAAGSWFMPFVSLYRPFQIMKEMYQETQKLLIQKGSDSHKNLNSETLNWWWTLWIISTIIGSILFQYSKRADTIDELTFVTLTSIVEGIIEIPLAIITVKIIKNYNEVEPLLQDVLEGEEQLIGQHLIKENNLE
ncbi:MAG: DUF4328 domain-containing protein [Leadbetterella sp.]